MFRHQFGQDLILNLDLLLQIGDPLLLGRMIRSCFLLEGSRPILEELLLPTIENRRSQSLSVAQFRDRHLLNQMLPQDGNFFFCAVVLSLLFMRSLRYLNGRTLSPFPTEPEHYLYEGECYVE